MTPFYIGTAIVALAAMAYVIFRQHGVLKNTRTLIADQNEKLHEQQQKIRTWEQDSQQSQALFSTIFDVAYDFAFVLDRKHSYCCQS